MYYIKPQDEYKNNSVLVDQPKPKQSQGSGPATDESVTGPQGGLKRVLRLLKSLIDIDTCSGMLNHGTGYSSSSGPETETRRVLRSLPCGTSRCFRKL